MPWTSVLTMRNDSSRFVEGPWTSVPAILNGAAMLNDVSRFVVGLGMK